MELIEKYFPELSAQQKKQFKDLAKLYEDWNQKINVISRKDISQLYLKHVLHSLGIAKIEQFVPQQRILDVGTGGGFPGIPLAILYPETDFILIDSIQKKIKVVEEVAEALGLKNVSAQQIRAEKVTGKFNFVISRAVTQMPIFIAWVRQKFLNEKAPMQRLENGILYLKGGDLDEEMKGIKYLEFELSRYFEEDFFETKKLIYFKP
ncbi:Ribosomal RNA small subunit methyltransferase G [Candidatus Ornithobacterium hominis]|uniref:Ribosomal RNA small subunit methyltransferase G n=1 Tax=Candidatus Ornithobacterium hominis TaxID=2497989 RepID=A0A383U3C3_9FLAO|nr:16S rRNA (guanine(527)-N(7))-methyltransferase RsmG [Candidatus Ornithobacterium hominis]MCT7904572.1 16S rRNA (guanine(527)-N(7))-methyltransferase RsmG [Candidatus Ornithobacterium hominis]SZD74087.1 Ribosomal RNA small subunit methyltransferase G [Candidatus Ornithobacterium hominis]